ncbi:OmpA family protein [Flavobacterium sp. HSC-61S13]|uniref:OmpA family protein n=1 Tax=Flavobacterium sp. HSC-61S13 TaxID=2910963 RepID=UPI00209DE2ED|nr:OmpA family protein [Flavobacterium sp. HSC-61S13]MCP1996496.1 outer membrane protein OmpA-like peptidoglycan-associated protein [Flavobacterium sp. HSC-61S13]
MKVNIKNILWGISLLLTTTLYAQERRADKKYDQLAYIDAIRIYERVADKGYHSQKLYQNIGNSYYFNGKLADANIWYGQLFELPAADKIPTEYYYRYAQTLKATNQYAKADSYLEKFAALEVEDSRSVIFKANKDYLAEIKRNSGRYSMERFPVNTPFSDYGATVYNKQLIFTSSRDKTGFSTRIHTWTGEPFTRLYAADLGSDGKVGHPKIFATEVASMFNESTPVISADGNTMYFTRNNFLNGERKMDDKGTTLLKIYKATLENDRWTNVQELPFNSDQFNTAHPALTADGKWLIFASDREGTLGQSDLYKVAIGAHGTFGYPINLGAQINTAGRESFPFINADNELYFSTDGRPGLGGLDIYVTQMREDHTFSEVYNLGEPINGSDDDFAYYIDAQTRKGFFSSNRTGNDDIYSFNELKRISLDCKQMIYGQIYDQPTATKLASAQVTLWDVDFNKLAETTSNAKGEYAFKDLNCGTRYRVKVVLEDYNTAEVTVNLPLITDKTQADFGLEKNRVEIKKGDDLFKVLKLEPIYFDFDKAEIRPDAQVELAKIVEVMNEYPQMVIDVRSHTDSRGNDNYNLRLSDKRAKATAKWIVEQGILSSRVMSRGFGETKPINACVNGKSCTEQQHQENRRSEFIILEM